MGQGSKEVKQAWLERNKHKRPTINRHWKLRRVYGLSPEDYQEMLDSQNNTCRICKKSFSEDNRAYVDHDHTSRWVRGLLCNNCNSGLGFFDDNVEWLTEAANYVISGATPTEFCFASKSNPKRVHSPEWRAAASARHKGNTYNQGKTPWNKGKTYNLPRRKLTPLYEMESTDAGI